jgi:hypothetical protein
MTNVQALQRLDHVCLWIARWFTAILAGVLVLPTILFAFVLALGAFVFLFEQYLLLLSPHLRTILLSQPEPWPPALPHIWTDPHHLLALTFALLWFTCVRLLPSISARLCLGLSSVYFAVMSASLFAVLMIVAIFQSSGMAFAGILFSLFFFVGFLGFASMVWISIRPPRNSPSSANRTESHYLLQPH